MANSIALVDGNVISTSVPVAATAGQVLSSNGTTLAWTNPSTGTVTGTGVASQLAYWDSATGITGNNFATTNASTIILNRPDDNYVTPYLQLTNGNANLRFFLGGDQARISIGNRINLDAGLNMLTNRGLYLSNVGIYTPNSKTAMLVSENNDITGTRTSAVTLGESLGNSVAGTSILGVFTNWRTGLTVSSQARLDGQTSALGMIGSFFSQTITAPANNSFLAGVVIRPSFTNGAFTGVTNVALGIENSSGYSIYQTGTAPSYLAGALLVGNSTNNNVNILQVTGDTLLKGSGGSGTTSALSIQNNGGTQLFTVRNDGTVSIVAQSTVPLVIQGTSATFTFSGSSLTNGIMTLDTTALRMRSNSASVYVVNDGDSGTSSVTILAGRNGANTAFAPVIIGSGLFLTVTRETMRIDNQNQRVGIVQPSPAAKLHISGTETAASAVARGGYFNNTLVAAANSDVLVALDIAPTFTNGAFTGVQNYAIRASGQISAGSTQATTGSVVMRSTYSSGNISNIGTNGSSGGMSINYAVYPASTSTADAYLSGLGFASFPRSSYIVEADHRWLSAASAIVAEGSAVTMTENMRLYNNGNLVLQTGGVYSNGTQKLQVYGDTLMKGTGNTSGSTALSVQNSDATSLLTVRNDGLVTVPSNLNVNGYLTVNRSGGGILTFQTSTFTEDAVSTTGRLVLNNGGFLLTFQSGTSGLNLLPATANEANNSSQFRVSGRVVNNAHGIQVNVGTNASGAAITGTFAATGTYSLDGLNNISAGHLSGVRIAETFTAVLPTQSIRYSGFTFESTISQSGGANGITRGLYINPTLTTPADFRAVEWSNNSGYGLYGAGTAQNLLNGKLTVNHTVLAANFTNANTIGVLSSQLLNIPTGNRGAAGNVYGATTGANYFRFNGATTLLGDSLWSGSVALSNVQFDTTGTITMANSATGGYRPLSVMQLQMQGSGGNSGTVDRGATLFIQGVYPSSLTGTITFTDYAAIRINDLKEWGSTTVVLTNRWGIYQAGADDKNYFAASVGIGVDSPVASAKLQVNSTTQGFLPPRMTGAEMNAIGTPAPGLIVYNTTDNKHYGYNGTTWTAFY